MTPLLAAPVLVTLTCFVAIAQDRAPSESVLKGTWCEKTLPGEKADDKLTISFTGEKLSLSFGGQVLQGTFESEPDSATPSLTIHVTIVNGRALDEKRVYLMQYLLNGDTLLLHLTATAKSGTAEFKVESPSSLPSFPRYEGKNDWESLRKHFEELEKLHKEYNKRIEDWKARIKDQGERFRSAKLLDLAPVTFRLEKVKK